MRARAAYISSFGTTTILVAGAVLLLAVVSAIVAFHGWPSGAAAKAVPSVPLTAAPRPVPHRVRAVRKVAPAPAARVRRVVVPGLHKLRMKPATAGLVKVVPVRAPEALALGAPPSAPAGHVAQPVPAATARPDAPPPAAPAGPPGHPAPVTLPNVPAAPTADELAALVDHLVAGLPPVAISPPATPDPLGLGAPLAGTGVSVP